jgi:hypothetical protein
MINDEFRHISSKLQLWSFFEVLPTNMGPTSAIVVDKVSSVIGTFVYEKAEPPTAIKSHG